MAWARLTGPLEIARDHMGLNLFFVEIPGTQLGPTLRSKLLRTAPFAGKRSHERSSGQVKARGRRASSRPGVKEARPCGESALAAEGKPVSSVGSGRPNAWRRGNACPACGQARGAEHRRSRTACCRGPLRAEPASRSATRLSLRQSPPRRTQPAP